MSGSLTWRTYTADNGEKFSVKVNKSLANGVLTLLETNITSPLGGLLFPLRNADYPPLPKHLKMRHLNLRYSLPDVSRKRLNIIVPIGNYELVPLLWEGFATIQWESGRYALGSYYDVSSYQGEFRKIPIGGLQGDG